MNSVGATLRNEREQKGIRLVDVASQTRIRLQYLTAIEADDTASLPGGFFYRSFVRQYATALGLDPAELEAQIDRIMPPPPPIPQVSGDAIAENPIKDIAPILTGGLSRSRRGSPIGLQLGLLVVVVIGCTAFYAWWDKSRTADREKTTVAQASPPSVDERSSAPSTGGSDREQAQPAPQQALPAADPAAGVQPVSLPLPTGGGGELSAVSLDLSATEPTWVSVSSGGKIIFSGVVTPSENKTVAAKDSARMTIGNAGGLEVRLNGKPIGPIGPKGQVRKVVFTPERFEIIDPRKSL